MKRILVVDDEVAILEALEDVLVSEGYEVRVAHHGLEALQVMEVWRPDLLLMDLMMPVMDGLTLLERLRDKHQKLRVPVVVMSAGRLNLPPELAPPFLAKPFELDYLSELIRKTLGTN